MGLLNINSSIIIKDFILFLVMDGYYIFMYYLGVYNENFKNLILVDMDIEGYFGYDFIRFSIYHAKTLKPR